MVLSKEVLVHVSAILSFLRADVVESFSHKGWILGINTEIHVLPLEDKLLAMTLFHNLG